MLYQRKIFTRIKKKLFKGKAVLIYGARQVGKTTLVKALMREYPASKSLYLNADEYDVQTAFEEAKNFTELKSLIGSSDLVIIDEAQRIRDIGLKLKILVDNLTDTQIIATGSSSFDLANIVNEPLTGRSYSFTLYPLSITELSDNSLELSRNMKHALKYGLYPGIYNLAAEDIRDALNEITEQYLFKDLLSVSGIKKSDYLIKLLRLLAYQISSTVSYNEIATVLGLDQATVIKYIDILEKSFVIFRLGSFSQNLRNEIKKNQKIYFYDLGIRNSLINDFNDLDLRADIGQLWENFAIIERVKSNYYQGYNPSYYFWRNYDKQEIDLVEDWGREKDLQCFEFKYRPGAKYRFPKTFSEKYVDAEKFIIDTKSFIGTGFVGS
ncbi:MAG: ATP-binding protein [bacterium]